MQFQQVSYKGVDFYVPAGPAYGEGDANEVGMQHWFNDSLRSTLSYAEQLWYINRFVTESPMSILEVFCGFGMSTAPIGDERIEHHVAMDHDPACCEAFKLLRPDAKVFETDSYIGGPLAAQLQVFDYVLLEFNAMTTYRAMTDERERAMLDAIFSSGARHVVFVDSAKVKMHLHLKTYSRVFNYPVECSDAYVRAIDRHFQRTYGYRMKACSHDAINYTFLFEVEGGYHGDCDIHDVRPSVRLDKFKNKGLIDVDVQA